MVDARRHLIRWFAPSVLFLLPSWIGATLNAHQGTIIGLTVTPTEARAGATVTATAAGNGLCGAVHIDWGDGNAITYATSTLPVTQTHVYTQGGTFTVRAQGMGNCAGQAATRVKIEGPRAPSPVPTLRAVEVSPATVAPRVPVSIALTGDGACRISVDFGDGNSQELNGAFPLSVRHTYPLAGTYTIVAKPLTPCGQSQSAELIVGARPNRPRIDAVVITRPANSGEGARAIRVEGVGRCAYTLDYGDGNSEQRNADLPDVMRHNYPAAGRYIVVATPSPPCAGTARAEIAIGGGDRAALSRIDVPSRDARPGEPVGISLVGSGTCRITIDFGDGTERELTRNLPFQVTHRFMDAGDYEILAWTDPPCIGEGSAVVHVRKPPGP